jgi:hypothetical protein
MWLTGVHHLACPVALSTPDLHSTAKIKCGAISQADEFCEPLICNATEVLHTDLVTEAGRRSSYSYLA